MPTARTAALGLLLAVVLMPAGCGSSKHAAAQSSAAPRGGSGAGGSRSRGQTGVAADPHAVAVIRQWSSALRHGDVLAAARMFALPSLLVNGVDAAGNPTAIQIRTLRDAVIANASLPCGARFVAADRRGRFTNALFTLSSRPGPGGGSCAGGTGQTARTDFVISHGKIVQWIRAPDDPGDNGTPGPSPATPQPPATPTNPDGQPNGGPAV
jgi:hypothetical protein